METDYIFRQTVKSHFEYLSLRYSFIGRGVSSKFNFLDINGVRVIKMGSEEGKETWGSSEAGLLDKLGNAGWRMLTYSAKEQVDNVELTVHYAKFIRQKA